MATKTITIATVIDVVGALASDTLSEHIYLMDTNKANGSTGLGTENLKTMVKKGDRLVWTLLTLECEAYAIIEDIIIDKDYCKPKKKTYEGTDITYWVGTVKKDVKVAPYKIKFKVGSRVQEMTIASTPCLVGKGV